MRREVKYGSNSKIDVLLEQGEKKCWVEVKNVTLFQEDSNLVEFPDSVTTRGLKHLNDLIAQVKLGDRAVMFYLVNRPEGDLFRAASSIDPEYAAGLKRAVEAGVEILCYRTHSTLEEMSIGDSVRFSAPN
jgi:sugar fermentation stimulation protein A